MWNASKNKIPESQIRAHYLNIIQQAVNQSTEFHPLDNPELIQALNHFQDLAPTGVKNFYSAIQSGNIQKLQTAALQIQRLI